MDRDDAQGLTLQEIADLLLEPVSRVRRALKDCDHLQPLQDGSTGWQRRYEIRSVLRFMGFYRVWSDRLRREKKMRREKALESLFAADPRALLDKVRNDLAKASADIAAALKGMRHEGLVPIQFLGDARLKPREPFVVSLSVRGAQGRLVVAEMPELGLSVRSWSRKAVLDRLRREIEALYWRLKSDPEAEPARWATLQQMLEERTGS